MADDHGGGYGSTPAATTGTGSLRPGPAVDYAHLFAQGPLPQIVLDARRRVVAVNHAFSALLHREEAEVLARPLTDLLAAADRATYASRFERLAGGDLQRPAVFNFLMPGGAGCAVELHGRSVRSADGAVVGVHEALVDIRSRLREDQRLLDQLVFTEQLADLAREAHGSLSLAQGAPRVCARIRQCFGFDLVMLRPRVLATTAGAGGELAQRIFHDTGEESPHSPELTVLMTEAIALPICTSALRSGAVRFSADAARDDTLDARTRDWAQRFGVSTLLVVPLRTAADFGPPGGVVAAIKLGPALVLGADDVRRVEALVDVAATGIENALLHEKLVATEKVLLRQARTDGLTGLPNRMAFEEALRSEFARSQRYGAELSVLMFDIDQFKQFNTEHGHLVGDAVLRHVGEAVRAVIRRNDQAGRWGGDEFVILALETPAAGALSLAGRLMEQIALPGRLPAGLEPVTISVGVFTYEPGMADPPATALDLVARADEALLAAKAGGRKSARRWDGPLEPDAGADASTAPPRP